MSIFHFTAFYNQKMLYLEYRICAEPASGPTEASRLQAKRRGDKSFAG